jgi:hypothetical protein
MWEYAHMFDLDDATLASAKILGVGDGPASFNAQMHALGRARLGAMERFLLDYPAGLRRTIPAA